MSEFADGLTEEGANQLLEQVRHRLPVHNYSIASTIAEILEFPIPEGADIKQLDHEVWSVVFQLIAESFDT